MLTICLGGAPRFQPAHNLWPLSCNDSDSRRVCCHQDLLPDAVGELREYLSYPLEETLAANASAEVVADDFRQVADAVLAAHDSGALAQAARDGPAAFKVSPVA